MSISLIYGTLILDIERKCETVAKTFTFGFMLEKLGWLINRNARKNTSSVLTLTDVIILYKMD